MKVIHLRRMGSCVLSVLICFAVVAAVSCKGKTARESMAEKMLERAIEKSSGEKADVDLRAGKVKIKSGEGEGEISFGGQSWPNDLPEGVPSFPWGKVKGVTRSSIQEKKTWNVILEEVEDGALEKLTEALKQNGWEILSSTTASGGGSVQATKGDLMVLAIINTESKAGSIGISTGNEE